MIGWMVLVLGAHSVEGVPFPPGENPVLAPIYVESCTPEAPRQAIYYPPQLIGTGVSGRVELVLFLNPCGKVRHVLISKSSGAPDLDVAAVESAKDWVISPDSAKLEPRRGGIVILPIQFTDETRP